MLPVILDPAAIRTPHSPKSPRLSRSSLSTATPRTSLDVPISPPSNRPISPIPSPFFPTPTLSGSPRYASLYLAVRETAVDPGMNIRVNAVNWRTFVEKCRNDSLEEIKSIVDKAVLLRSTFEQDSNVGHFHPIGFEALTPLQCICLIDIILGAIEATWKLLAHPETMNVNRHITHTMTAINAALAPYKSFSQRQLAKRGEPSMLFLQEMLLSIVSTMWIVGAVFAAKDDGEIPLQTKLWKVLI